MIRICQYIIKSYHIIVRNNSLEIFIKLINAMKNFFQWIKKNNEMNDLNI